MRLSHSSKNKYLTCGELFRLHYIMNYRPLVLSSALLFGSAGDEAFNELLVTRNLDKSIDIFNRKWEQGQDSRRNTVDLPLNPEIKYFKSDWDSDLLEKKDWAELFKYDANLFESRTKVDELLKEKTPWLQIPEDLRMVYNYANWMCLRKKGHLLLQAFYDQILPQIKAVIAVQKKVELDDGEGNILNGVVDYVCELQDGRIAVMDNKTSSSEYDEDQASSSEQLATYYSMLNIFNEDSEHEWKHKIDCVGYSVLSKKILKDITKTCESCGHIATGSHKTCDNTVNGKRCNGKWDKVVKLDVKTQFIIGNIHEEFAQSVLDNASTVRSCIEQGLFPKNYSACADQFGSPCVMFAKCHKGSDEGLIKLEEKK